VSFTRGRGDMKRGVEGDCAIVLGDSRLRGVK